MYKPFSTLWKPCPVLVPHSPFPPPLPSLWAPPPLPSSFSDSSPKACRDMKPLVFKRDNNNSHSDNRLALGTWANFQMLILPPHSCTRWLVVIELNIIQQQLMKDVELVCDMLTVCRERLETNLQYEKPLCDLIKVCGWVIDYFEFYKSIMIKNTTQWTQPSSTQDLLIRNRFW